MPGRARGVLLHEGPDPGAPQDREKRRIRKGFILEYRAFTRALPDIRQYSQVPGIEKEAARVGRARQISEEKRLALAEQSRVRTPEELDREVAELEAMQGTTMPQRRRKLPKRPAFWLNPLDRYKWALEYALAGGDLPDEDRAFVSEYEAEMSEGQREYWENYKEMEANG